VAERNKGFEITAHVANAGNAIGEQERKHEFAASVGFAGGGEVDVHVDESGDKNFPCASRTCAPRGMATAFEAPIAAMRSFFMMIVCSARGGAPVHIIIVTW